MPNYILISDANVRSFIHAIKYDEVKKWLASHISRETLADEICVEGIYFTSLSVANAEALAEQWTLFGDDYDKLVEDSIYYDDESSNDSDEKKCFCF